MKQTSVSWMIEILSENGFLDLRCDNNEAQRRGAELQRIIDTAISMEKKQIISAYVQGCQDSYDNQPMTEAQDEGFGKMYYYNKYLAGQI